MKRLTLLIAALVVFAGQGRAQTAHGVLVSWTNPAVPTGGATLAGINLFRATWSTSSNACGAYSRDEFQRRGLGPDAGDGVLLLRDGARREWEPVRSVEYRHGNDPGGVACKPKRPKRHCKNRVTRFLIDWFYRLIGRRSPCHLMCSAH
ncbi:MAG: hypothetical protein WAO35_12280 [Terriglobia bacterium]